MDETTYLTDKKFEEFDLPTALAQGLKDAGFSYCSRIQAQALPLLLEGHDVAGQAQTGTGKTAAFLLATYNRLLTIPPSTDQRPTSVRAVILAPTRELAIQIYRDAETLGKHTDLRLGLVYGGTGYHKQREDLSEGVDILVGTPGRLIDYFKQGIFDLKGVQAVVLDEADRMFDLGFIRDIRFVLRRMPAPTNRLNMLFSATLSLRVSELAYEHMNNPTEVKIESSTPVAPRLLEDVYYPANSEKLTLLLGLLKQTPGDRILIFANMRVTCDRLGRSLKREGYSAGVLSGDVPQNKREKLLKDFTEGRQQILVATDVAARGLHIPSVSHVFNYDLPQDPEDYVHRTGRTARAGASGHAISFACEDHAFSLMDIESFIGHPLTKREISDAIMRAPRDAATQHKGQRSEAKRPPKQDKENASVVQTSDPPKRTVAANPTVHKKPGGTDNTDQRVLSPRNQSAERIAPAVAKQHTPPEKTRRTDFESPAVG
ncbi:MAG: DEAD/DEAH box helicase [Gammaproteobacteria bacterium]|nr:DEAD/DEAH box helicase [Gammaproteobacteria bacterium]